VKHVNRPLLFLCAAALAACAADKSAVKTAVSDSTSGGDSSAASGANAAVATGDVTRGGTALASDTTPLPGIPVAEKDSNGLSKTVWVPDWRGKRDSIALLRAVRAGERHPGWPPKAPAAAPGALLPGRRIIAYDGNPLSKKMGVLGEYEVNDMLARLDKQIAEWKAADPNTPITPALHLIAVVAQGAPGRDGKYRLRMDSSLIEKVYGWAQQKNALLFLDVQTGWSTYQDELPRLMKFLERPNVHFGMDPEFNMHGNREGVVPGKKIGTVDAADVNYVTRTLAKLVQDKKLPPKILVLHRFTRPMVTNYKNIQLDPHVQLVLDMDGWGAPWLKYDSYKDYIVSEPVHFTGIKLFYHNDTKKGDRILTPREVLQLVPRPVYIQYQ
jgi:hypothetical protein